MHKSAGNLADSIRRWPVKCVLRQKGRDLRQAVPWLKHPMAFIGARSAKAVGKVNCFPSSLLRPGPDALCKTGNLRYLKRNAGPIRPKTPTVSNIPSEVEVAQLPDNDADPDRYRAPALDKGLDILELLAATAVGLTQGEIARQLERTSSEIFRMLFVLRQRGYVVQGTDDRYVLTTKLFEVAHRHPPIRRLTAIAGQAMQDLANRINQSIHMSILQSGRLLVVAQVDCPDHFLATVRLGANIPIYDSASGRAIAAFLSVADLTHLLTVTGNDSEVARDSFLADLPMVRQNGYYMGISHNIAGVIDLSAPVFDFNGSVVAAITTPFIQRNNSVSLRCDEAMESLVATCHELSRRLGAGAAEPR